MIRLPDKLEKQVDVYRRNRKLETGKMVTRNSAVCEILERALSGVKDESPASLVDLTRRVERLEATVLRAGEEREQ